MLDADQVADPRILRALAGYMRFDGLGFIQSRQFYVVPDGDPFFNLDRRFLSVVGPHPHDLCLAAFGCWAMFAATICLVRHASLK